MPKKLIIFPFGGNGREAAGTILGNKKLRNEWKVIGFIDDDRALPGTVSMGVRVLGGRKIIKKYPDAFVLAVPGSPETFSNRIGLLDDLSIPRNRLATVIDPSAVIFPGAVIGVNCFIMANVFVSCGAKVGDHCIVLPNTVISHDASVGDYSIVGSNVSISGGVSVGRNCYVGSGVSLRERLHVGSGALIGIGSNVTKDVDKGAVMVGNPAYVMRKVNE